MMSVVVEITPEQIVPTIGEILAQQGVPPEVKPDDITASSAQRGIDLFERLSRPVGTYSVLSREEFARVYQGDGKNETDTPLGGIYARADKLALFAVTLGHEIENEIRRLFEQNEFPLGAMLDAAASVGAEKAAEIAQDCFQKELEQLGEWSDALGLMPFSPGYCGWHISGQAALFDALHPEKIGVRLSASYLMQPLKSISGLFVAGRREIFEFDDNFTFCSECATRSCRERLVALRES